VHNQTAEPYRREFFDMKTFITANKVILLDCKVKDIITASTGLNLLNQTITKIVIQNYFDFDTKYYHRFSEDMINDIYRTLQRETEVKLQNNRLYYNGIVLPDDEISSAEIYFQ
jgi:hypothetical protein